MSKNSTKVIRVKRIINKYYPVFTKKGRISKKWKRAHARANVLSREKHGKKKAREVTALVRRTPENELLGIHTPKKGTIIISKRVPKKLIPAIVTHEKEEHRLMTKKKKYIYKK